MTKKVQKTGGEIAPPAMWESMLSQEMPSTYIHMYVHQGLSCCLLHADSGKRPTYTRLEPVL